MPRRYCKLPVAGVHQWMTHFGRAQQMEFFCVEVGRQAESVAGCEDTSRLLHVEHPSLAEHVDAVDVQVTRLHQPAQHRQLSLQDVGRRLFCSCTSVNGNVVMHA